MSGRQALKEAIKHAGAQAADRRIALRRGTVTALKPTITVELHSLSQPLHADNDMVLSQWMHWYDKVVGIAVDDMVLVQQEGADWVLVDVVSHKDAGQAFEDWRTS